MLSYFHNLKKKKKKEKHAPEMGIMCTQEIPRETRDTSLGRHATRHGHAHTHAHTRTHTQRHSFPSAKASCILTSSSFREGHITARLVAALPGLTLGVFSLGGLQARPSDRPASPLHPPWGQGEGCREGWSLPCCCPSPCLWPPSPF